MKIIFVYYGFCIFNLIVEDFYIISLCLKQNHLYDYFSTCSTVKKNEEKFLYSYTTPNEDKIVEDLQKDKKRVEKVKNKGVKYFQKKQINLRKVLR